MGKMASQITNLMIVYSTVTQAQIKENTKVPRHWPLCEEFTGTGVFPSQRASNAENVSIWWRHHDIETSPDLFNSMHAHSCTDIFLMFSIPHNLSPLAPMTAFGTKNLVNFSQHIGLLPGG